MRARRFAESGAESAVVHQARKLEGERGNGVGRIGPKSGLAVEDEIVRNALEDDGGQACGHSLRQCIGKSLEAGGKRHGMACRQRRTDLTRQSLEVDAVRYSGIVDGRLQCVACRAFAVNGEVPVGKAIGDACERGNEEIETFLALEPSDADAQPRGLRLLSDLRAAHGPDDVVVLVSHQYFAQFLLAPLVGFSGPPWQRFRIDNTATVHLHLREDFARVAWVNRVDHLATEDVTN